jgi:N-acetyltransferase
VSAPIAPFELEGRHVRLEPLAHEHAEPLVAAASEGRQHFGYTVVPAGSGDMERYVASLVAGRGAGDVVPFVQRQFDADGGPGRIVGCTRFMTLRHFRGRAEPDEVEIGGTWLAESVQGTRVNAEAKLLLLTHAFDVWGVWRVDFCTDARNERSRAALARLGATFEGVLRCHRPAADTDGSDPRDSAVYAITRDDWNAVATALRARVDA